MKKKSIYIAIIILLFDWLIKYIIDKSFYYGILKSIIPNIFYLTKVYNEGAAWSTFWGSRYLLIFIGIVAFIFLYFYEGSFRENKRNILAFGLVYGGLFGNLVDRISYGYVIDYLKLIIGDYDFPIFNLADVCIVVGFILIIYAIYKGEDKSGSKSRSRKRKNR